MSQEIEKNHFSSSHSFLLLTLPFPVVYSLDFLKVFFLNLTWSTLSSFTLTFLWIQRMNFIFSPLSSSPWPTITLTFLSSITLTYSYVLSLFASYPLIFTSIFTLTPPFFLLIYWPHYFSFSLLTPYSFIIVFNFTPPIKLLLF